MMTCQPPSFDQHQLFTMDGLRQRWKVWIERCAALRSVGRANGWLGQSRSVITADSSANDMRGCVWVLVCVCGGGGDNRSWASPAATCGTYRCTGRRNTHTHTPHPPVSIVGYINGVISGVHLWGISTWKAVLSSWGFSRCACIWHRCCFEAAKWRNVLEAAPPTRTHTPRPPTPQPPIVSV